MSLLLVILVHAMYLGILWELLGHEDGGAILKEFFWIFVKMSMEFWEEWDKCLSVKWQGQVSQREGMV